MAPPSKLNDLSINISHQCTQMRFASSLSSGFITAIVVNPPKRKLAKRISVQCEKLTGIYFQAYIYLKMGSKMKITFEIQSPLIICTLRYLISVLHILFFLRKVSHLPVFSPKQMKKCPTSSLFGPTRLLGTLEYLPALSDFTWLWKKKSCNGWVISN